VFIPGEGRKAPALYTAIIPKVKRLLFLRSFIFQMLRRLSIT